MKKTFDELQHRMVETRSQMQWSEMQERQRAAQIKHRTLTLTELRTHPDDTRMYNGIGRMFLLETKAETTTRLEKDVTDFTKQIEDMKKNKEYLERQYKDSEGNLRELLRHR
eukprot:m.36077 g.36077  ORF g.36077 m.36077 type:complete len:112 (-) comp12830_c0_seq2:3162-3497(-)